MKLKILLLALAFPLLLPAQSARDTAHATAQKSVISTIRAQLDSAKAAVTRADSLLSLLSDGEDSLLVPPPAPPPVSPIMAELPRVYVDPYIQPSVSHSVAVNSCAALQPTIDSITRGGAIDIAPGLACAAPIYLRAKPGTGWVTIRRAGGAHTFGQRMTPTSAAALQLPRIEIRTSHSHGIRTDSGAQRYIVEGLEIAADTGLAQVWTLIEIGRNLASDSTVGDIVLRGLYVHGAPDVPVQRGVSFNGYRLALADSWVDNVHMKGTDTQAVSSWNGVGPFAIINNTLVASGENIMIGGGNPAIAGLIPSDVEIRGNDVNTPLSYRGSGPPNTPWTRKNLLEFKFVRRVLVEGNIFRGSWADGQNGYAVVVKSTNQNGGCTWCLTADVTIRKNIFSDVGTGFLLAGREGSNQHPLDSLTRRVVIEDNILEGMKESPITGSGLLVEINQGISQLRLSRNLLTKRNGTQDKVLALPNGNAATDVIIDDNVFSSGQYGVFASGGAVGQTAWDSAIAGLRTWSGNVVLGSATPNKFPTGTSFATDEASSVLAQAIRALVQGATAGVLVSP